MISKIKLVSVLTMLLFSIGNISSADSYYDTRNGKTYYCQAEEQEEQPSSYQCVPRCNSRSLSGNCYEWGSDFCGYNPTCVEACTARNLSGNCYEWAADFCGTNPVCVEVCTARNLSGNCYEWASDNCYENY